MFRKLRNKIIITNLVFTTLVLVVAFSGIFVSAVSRAKFRPMPFPADGKIIQTREMNEYVEKRIERERSESLNNLATTLIVAGFLIEFLVFTASYLYAEKSIKPVKEAYYKQREFIANASHELKTPIAAVQANFEALGTTEQPWTNNVETELNRASKLVSDLLLLARTDGRTTESKKKSENVSKIINQRIDLIRSRLGEKQLEIDVPEKITVDLNASDLMQITDILLDNAIKYSSKKISVKLTKKALYIKNDGKTIPESKLGKIFDRFYQTDKTSEGSGLGLSIAKAVADHNNWKIEVKSENRETEFSVKF